MSAVDAHAISHPEVFKPFLLLSTRPEDDMAQQERSSFVAGLGVADCLVEQRRVDQSPLGVVDLDRYSGIIIGGSPYNSTDSDKPARQVRVEQCLHEVISAAIDADFPVLGACYGVGIIGSAAGGTVCRTYAEPAGCIQVHVTDDGARDPLLAGVGRDFYTLVGHKEACSVMPDGAVLLVRGDNCPVQMFRIGRNVYVTQFHPELDFVTFRNRLVAYEDAGYFGPGEMQSILDGCAGRDLTVACRVLKNFAATHLARR